MNILVTGAAGFIGSHLCERLLKEGHRVVGVDTFIGPTPLSLKRENIKSLLTHSHFQLIENHLMNLDLQELLSKIDVVYHLAAIPGVRASWGTDFDPYVTNNILATQRLLEACKDTSIKQLIYASTSSAYGEMDGKVSEDKTPQPLSPYGITKLAGEHLCHVYSKYYGVPTTILRFFTVFGPRQRPDMAFHRFIKQILLDEPISVFGDGTQTRDFTYISDCIDGVTAVLNNKKAIGETINIGGKERASVLEVIEILEKIAGKKAKIHYSPTVIGEPKHTWADISKASQLLAYTPAVSLTDGLQNEWNHLLYVYGGNKP
ncbi:NAD-dependent epimerase/dehydratase family protein [Metabacillus iocasae]|uniref:Nucleoside-diphosphate-sugar epimerase n=1 Tax=Priestia iocasae TaxID=2291674 RepID=A0ABS2QY16_9BACI|nr:NAD-dependent epimerase/dehydratase family protein [Metabacillus iocasae]MBM7704381.1 nucleoside-diphosphate-sugar epimerase [Metabacillus iocasae]